MNLEEIATQIANRNNEARQKAASVSRSMSAALASENWEEFDGIVDEIASRELAELRGSAGEDSALGTGDGAAVS